MIENKDGKFLRELSRSSKRYRMMNCRSLLCNVRGQLGKTLSFPTTFVFVFVLLLLFLLFTAAIIPFKTVHTPRIVGFSLGDSVLYQSVDFEGKQVFLLELLTRISQPLDLRGVDPVQVQKQRNIEQSQFVKGLLTLTKNDDQTCLLLSSPSVYYFVRGSKVDTSGKEYQLPLYKTSADFHQVSLSLSGKRGMYQWYLGRCLRG